MQISVPTIMALGADHIAPLIDTAFIGHIGPVELATVGMNQLTGPIPSEIGNLTQIVNINLQSNGLTGKLPSEFGNLRYLQEVRLDRNKLQGPVPANGTYNFASSMHGMYASTENATGFCRSPQLKIADLSYNFLVGSIPKYLEFLPRSSFQGNCLQGNEPNQRPSIQCGGASPAKSQPVRNNQYHPIDDHVRKHHRSSKPTWLLALEIVAGTMVGSLFLIAALAAVQRCNNNKSSIIIPWKKSSSQKDHTTVYIDPDMLKDVRRYSRQELEEACGDFSNIIGSSPDSV